MITTMCESASEDYTKLPLSTTVNNYRIIMYFMITFIFFWQEKKKHSQKKT